MITFKENYKIITGSVVNFEETVKVGLLQGVEKATVNTQIHHDGDTFYFFVKADAAWMESWSVVVESNMEENKSLYVSKNFLTNNEYTYNVGVLENIRSPQFFLHQCSSWSFQS